MAGAYYEQHRDSFVKLFNELAPSHGAWEVWNDFIAGLSSSIQFFVTGDKAYGEESNRIEAKYSPEDWEKMSRMAAEMVESMDWNREQDFLGDIFMRLGIADKWRGQFFTPYSVASVMARMVGPTPEEAQRQIERKGFVSAADPACGAGVTLIATMNQLQQAGIGWDRVLFIGQDISQMAARMCHIQLTYYGCAGYVVIADTLMNPLVQSPDGISPVRKEGQTILYTPLYFSDVWQERIKWRRMDCLIRGERNAR